MKKILIVIAIAILLPLVSGFAQQPKLRSMMELQPDSPSPNWHLITTVYGPSIPAGWQVINMESLIQDGTTVQAWLVYLYNPTTRQTANWVVALNP